MISLALSLLLAQTAPTAADIKGALISVHNAQANLATRTITYPSGANMACVPPAAGTNTVGAKTLRVGVAAFSAEVQTALGATPLTMNVPVYGDPVPVYGKIPVYEQIPTYAGNEITGYTNGPLLYQMDGIVRMDPAPLLRTDTVVKPYVYGAMEVQYFPNSNPAVDTPEIPKWLRMLPDTEVEVRASAVWPACQLAIVREGFAAMPARCACSTGASCNWTPPLVGGGFGASTAAPKGMTLPPGLWSGSGCRPKPCVVFAQDTLGGADLSMPEACK